MHFAHRLREMTGARKKYLILAASLAAYRQSDLDGINAVMKDIVSL